MNSKLENQIFWIGVEAIFFVFCLTLLWSCGSGKVVTETVTVVVHDTVRTVKRDTIRDVKVVTLRDTLRDVERHFFTVNERGDTIREVHHHDVLEKVILVDSTERYQAKMDSLQAVIDKQREEKEKVVRKGIAVPWWAWIVTPAVFLLGMWVIVRKVLYKRWHIT